MGRMREEETSEIPAQVASSHYFVDAIKPTPVRSAARKHGH